MNSKCPGCGGLLDDRAAPCPVCRTAAPFNADPASRSVRRRLSIPFATLVVLGLAWAVVIGGGKPGNAHPAAANAAVGASINGKPVQIGGPAIAMLEKKLSNSDAKGRSPASSRTAGPQAQ